MTIETQVGMATKFQTLAEYLDNNRILAIIALLMFQGCVLAPTLLLTMFAAVGFSDFQVIMNLVGIFSVVTVVLAVVPMRYTLPVFGVASLIQISLIIFNLINM